MMVSVANLGDLEELEQSAISYSQIPPLPISASPSPARRIIILELSVVIVVTKRSSISCGNKGVLSTDVY